MDKLIQNSIVVKKSAIHGYGVFATHTIKKDDVIETCYALTAHTPDPALLNYYFGYEKKCLVLLGYGSIYNHSPSPNASYYFDEDKKIMVIIALKDILKDEEILISYGKDWFSIRNFRVKKISLLKKMLRYAKGCPQRALLVLGGLMIVMHLEYVSIAAKQGQKILEILAKTTRLETNA